MKKMYLIIAVSLMLSGCTTIIDEDRALIAENRELALEARNLSLQALEEARATRQDINKFIAQHR